MRTYAGLDLFVLRQSNYHGASVRVGTRLNQNGKCPEECGMHLAIFHRTGPVLGCGGRGSRLRVYKVRCGPLLTGQSLGDQRGRQQMKQCLSAAARALPYAKYRATDIKRAG